MDLVHGDAASARQLRSNLSVFARQSGNAEIHHLVSEVLSGRRNVRAVFRTKEFNDAGMKRLVNIEKGIAQLSNEQRAELFNPNRERTPDAVLAGMRDRYDAPEPLVQPGPDTHRSRVDDDASFAQRSIYER